MKQTEMWAKYRDEAVALECDDEAYDATLDRLNEPGNIRILHAGMGAAGEAGELLDYLKKCFFYGKEMDRAKIIGEVGDIQWYLTVLLDTMDVSMEEVLEKNIAKLQNRYGGQSFASYATMNRDEQQEQKIMEKKHEDNPSR